MVPTRLRGAHIDSSGHCFGLRIKSRALEDAMIVSLKAGQDPEMLQSLVYIVVCTKSDAFASPATLVDCEVGIICLLYVKYYFTIHHYVSFITMMSYVSVA